MRRALCLPALRFPVSTRPSRAKDACSATALADNSAISQAVALDADRVYVLPSGTACALDRPPSHPLAAALHALTLLLEQRAILETRTYAGTVDLHVMPPLCPLSIAAMDFSHAVTLIGRARRSTGQWLDPGSEELPFPERFLSLHGHRQVDRSTPPALPVAPRLAKKAAHDSI